MENFIDLFLGFLVVIVIAVTGGLIFLFIKDPAAAYGVMWSGIGAILFGAGFTGWKFYQKKQFGSYYDTMKELTQLYKEIIRTARQLEPSVKKAIRVQFPKMRQLRYEAQRRIHKVIDIEKDLRKIEKQHLTNNLPAFSQTPASRYNINIKTIEQAKGEYLQDIQNIIRFFHEMNSQLFVLKYANEKTVIQSKIAGMIDELLIDMQTLEEITYNYPK